MSSFWSFDIAADSNEFPFRVVDVENSFDWYRGGVLEPFAFFRFTMIYLSSLKKEHHIEFML